MIRPWQTWIVFGLCLAVVLAAMGWITFTALRSDRAEAEARRQAVLEENVRLALWRMESALAPLITRESACPYFYYNSSYAAERAYTRMFNEIQPGEVLMPSPLLMQVSPHILLHFQFSPDGELTSPQVPTGNMRDVAEMSYVMPEKIAASETRLGKLQGLLDRNELLSALSQKLPEPVPFPSSPVLMQGANQYATVDQQSLRNFQEWQARASNQAVLQTNVDKNILLRYSNVNEGVMRPVWVGEALVLARRVSANGQEYVQGCWLNWPAIKQWLMDEVRDLLPAAELEPVGLGSGDRHGRTLAALPVRLVPGAVVTGSIPRSSPIRLSLLIAWGCVLLAAIAVAALLRGAVVLSERRGAFVSAVTHELRTPLTTLRMYTEMLAEGMVSDEQKRRRYLNTLRTEADRLAHLLENVLAYARLEGRGAAARREAVELRNLLDRTSERLAQRAQQAGMSLVVEADDASLSVRTKADTAAVEQILFNLVDNACKYAASAANGVIHLRADSTGGSVVLRVRDHGPGIREREARRLFRPFSKSARDAANSMPGVGLGLALSRRLARSMGGDLQLDDDVKQGACFVLTLPAA